MKIKNAASIPLNQNTGTLPDVSGAMMDWFQPMVFGVVTKSVQDGLNVETVVNTNFNGVIQPLTSQKLMIKPEGQRSWKWFMVHAEPALVLANDSVITYEGQSYRVLGEWDFRDYGYVEYHLAQDYTGSAPTVTS